MTDLRPGFKSPVAYRGSDYRLLPFRFSRIDDKRYIVTNLVGQYALLTRTSLEAFIEGRLQPSQPAYRELLNKHFLACSGSDAALELLATKFRTKHSTLAGFTGLHMFVPTLRCDNACVYCQVSRVSACDTGYDMSLETARRAVDSMFRSPNPNLKVEFQGGEPLLNFDIVRHIVLLTEEQNQVEKRNLEFVVATNLFHITDDMLSFFKTHNVLISTSLDGPQELHTANRPRQGADSYRATIERIGRCREMLGPNAVSALMTTTRLSLEKPAAIVDEYVTQGFSSLFLRWLNPFGFAAKAQEALGYTPEEWARFYERALRHIISLNRSGVRMREEYASIVLRKMLTPYPSGFVDLQSPAGLGIANIIYNYNGDVFPSDESRMLGESGDFRFRLGNLHKHSYEEMFLSEQFLDVLSSTMTECTPRCVDCAFEPFCGAAPVFHYATQRDIVGHRPTSAFCSRNLLIFKLLILLMDEDEETRRLLTSWAC